MDIMDTLLLFAIAYILGSIPFGLLFVWLAGKGDIRDVGSGNIGATNVLRTGDKKLAIATLVADISKGLVIVLIAKYLELSEFNICSAAGLAIIGHIFPAWLRFKGGKGVATALGVYLGINPLVCLLVLITWLIMAKLVRISSLSALVALFMAPLYSVILGGSAIQVMFMMIVYLLIVWTHRSNISRIIKGEEAIIGKDKKI